MKKFIAILFIFSYQLSVIQGQLKIVPVPFTAVHFEDSFWLPRMEINRTVSIPSAFGQCEINGRLDNFAIAGGLKQGEHRGDFSFDDTDVYKIIEGAAYSLAVQFDSKLDAYLDSVIALIAAAQESDGYLTTCVTNRCTRLSGWWGTRRWEKINSHELYNSGHLYEAAVAHFLATGKRSLLEVALKNADLVCETFGLGETQIHYPSGHPIIEMALVKLYQVTGERKYLAQARYFVEEAGRLTNGRQANRYSQDHTPVLQQTEIVGHAVRAGYFYSGVTDVAAIEQDTALFAAVKRVWNNMASKKLYLNGGIGSRAQGEGFGPEYELNNFNNYCETCASIANVYWCHRMFLATGDARYVDVLERTLYNGVTAGVSLSGDRFFYDNPMASLGGHQRAAWFGCACCPGNVTRFMASVPLYNYATDGNTVYVNLYVQGKAKIGVGKDTVEIRQTTEYPWAGDVQLTVKTTPLQMKLMLRIPGWAQGKPVPTDLYHYAGVENFQSPQITINGKTVKYRIQNGYAVIERKWKNGDKVALHFDMTVQRVAANEQVEYDRGLLAIERGPVLYALEDTAWLFDLVIPQETKISANFERNLLGGVVTLSGTAYRNVAHNARTEVPFKAIPYSVWNNRGAQQLMVFAPAAPEYIIPKPAHSIAARASGGWGMNDGIEPKSSADLNTPYHYWWLKKGTEESVEYHFEKSETVSAVEVYWLAFEHYDVTYKAPKSWKLQYLDGKTWKDVANSTDYGTKIDQYNKLTFAPVTTKGLKIVAQLQEGFSGGIIEWRVKSPQTTSVQSPPAALNLPSFYKKYLNANGIHIIASHRVPDSAMVAAWRTVEGITAMLPPEVLAAMTKVNTRVGIMARYEGTTDIPEHAYLAADTALNWDLRARGLGGDLELPLTTCAEENILCYQIDKYHAEDILIHEFAHSIHLIGIISVFPDFNQRLEKLLNRAKEKGLWKNTYAQTDIAEYFAEGVQSWFNVNAEMPVADGKHNPVNTRAELKSYDYELYLLLSEFFPETDAISCHKCEDKYHVNEQ